MANNTDLRNVPTSELSSELWRRMHDPNSEVFSVGIWTKDDVEKVVPADKVDEFMRTGSKPFTDRTTELGWEVMEDLW